MALSRRQLFDVTLGAALLPASPRLAWAETYPARPVRWIVRLSAREALRTFLRG